MGPKKCPQPATAREEKTFEVNGEIFLGLGSNILWKSKAHLERLARHVP